MIVQIWGVKSDMKSHNQTRIDRTEICDDRLLFCLIA